MVRRVLIAGEPFAPLASSISDLRNLGSDVICDQVEWAELQPQQVAASAGDLLILVVAGAASAAHPFLCNLSREAPGLPVLVIACGDIEDELLQAVAAVADDFAYAPLRNGELRQRAMRLLVPAGEAPATIEERLVAEFAMAGLIGRAPAFLQTIAKIPRVARSKGPVLIIGETGTGKELCARAIHNLSPRSGLPFIPVDCGALPDHLFENELFGHVAGAFTDARSEQKGLIALADGGTLFLDEIDSLSLGAQAKLLRFLQERTFRPLGGSRFLRADVTVVAATNADLERLVQDKAFRSDLYYRLNLFRLELAPLRERRGDIPLLARHFVGTVCAEHGIGRKTLAPATIRKLSRLDWPGNVRELYNVIQRGAVFCEGAQILPSHIDDKPAAVPEARFANFRQARSQAIASFERRYVEDLLRECDFNVSRAARLAGKDRRAFGRLVKRYGIQRESL